jgi:MSHA pilin protein MshD
MNINRSRFLNCGTTLVELIVSIVIISVALSGVLIVIVRNTSASADPMIWHQATAIAEAYLEEILTKEFTDPTLPEGGESRATFDDVFDYNGLNDSPPRDQNGTAIAALAGYTVNVEVISEPLGTPAILAANVWRVTVTVTPPTGGAISISGYRTNY